MCAAAVLTLLLVVKKGNRTEGRLQGRQALMTMRIATSARLWFCGGGAEGPGGPSVCADDLAAV